ncbi:hypothetical protein ACFU8I_09455 [Streptomyces sp. NPDC057540]|uniref:hypothetical protein n=1 Tax=Streptomyces sp. NPDC057540 TaxID=3346160 RepID=UPI0036AE06CF
MAKGLLREAAAVLRRPAGEAVAAAGERWIVDQDETGALVVAAFGPDDVDPVDGTLSGTILATYAYPDHPQRATHAHAHALAAASHTAALDPLARTVDVGIADHRAGERAAARTGRPAGTGCGEGARITRSGWSELRGRRA